MVSHSLFFYSNFLLHLDVLCNILYNIHRTRNKKFCSDKER